MSKVFLFLLLAKFPPTTNGFANAINAKQSVAHNYVSIRSRREGKQNDIDGLNASCPAGTPAPPELEETALFSRLKFWKTNTKALHQLEHRAKEKTSIKLSETAVDQVLHHSEKYLERTVERIVEKAAKKSGERAVERAGERALERSAERVGEQALERVGERAAERTAERAAERAAKRVLENAGERAVERIGEQAAERVAERATERVGERALERVGERAAERATERVGERALERVGERAAERSGQRLFGVFSGRTALRLGRGVLITLPALGGIFALYLLKSDIKRLKEEWKLKVRSASTFFFGASLADGIDSFLHFFIVYALWKHWSHNQLALFEKLSLGCAIFSTLFAVAGEIISLRSQKRQQAALQVET